MERVQRLLWHLVAPLDEAQDACGVEEGTAPVVSIGEGVVEKEEEEQVAGILRSVRSFVGELVSDLVPGEDEVRMRREHRALRERMQKNQQQQQQWEEGDQGMMRWLNDSTAALAARLRDTLYTAFLSETGGSEYDDEDEDEDEDEEEEEEEAAGQRAVQQALKLQRQPRSPAVPQRSRERVAQLSERLSLKVASFPPLASESALFMVDSILTVLRLVSTTMLAAVAGAHQRVHRARPALREMALRQGVRWGATARLLHLLVVSPPGSLASSSARELAGEKGSKEQEQEQVERGDRRGRRGTGDASVSSRELQQLQSLAFQGAHSPSLQKFLARLLKILQMLHHWGWVLGQRTSPAMGHLLFHLARLLERFIAVSRMGLYGLLLFYPWLLVRVSRLLRPTIAAYYPPLDIMLRRSWTQLHSVADRLIRSFLESEFIDVLVHQ